jgi:hypothetical protein
MLTGGKKKEEGEAKGRRGEENEKGRGRGKRSGGMRSVRRAESSSPSNGQLRAIDAFHFADAIRVRSEF